MNITLVNFYKTHYCFPEELENQLFHYYSQREFRVRLTSQLLQHSERLSEKPSLLRVSLLSRVYSAVDRDHGGLERIKGKSKNCVVCLIAERKVSRLALIRKPLSELSANTVRPRDSQHRKRRDRIPRTVYECRLCEIHICNHSLLKGAYSCYFNQIGF